MYGSFVRLRSVCRLTGVFLVLTYGSWLIAGDTGRRSWPAWLALERYACVCVLGVFAGCVCAGCVCVFVWALRGYATQDAGTKIRSTEMRARFLIVAANITDSECEHRMYKKKKCVVWDSKREWRCGVQYIRGKID